MGRRQSRRLSDAKERFWRGHLTDQAASVLSIRGYCGQHSISEPSFYAWRREIARRDRARSRSTFRSQTLDDRSTIATSGSPAADFVRLEARPSLLGPGAPIEIVLPDQRRVLIPPGATREHVREVLAALNVTPVGESRSC
jgi:hypothetical protein